MNIFHYGKTLCKTNANERLLSADSEKEFAKPTFILRVSSRTSVPLCEVRGERFSASARIPLSKAVESLD